MTAVASAFRLGPTGPRPMPPMHLQGMGVMGCLVGQLLDQLGIEFTWSDSDWTVNSWQACTGVIYPSGHALDNENLASWMTHDFSRPWLETGRWTYYSKNPPHGGRFAEIGRAGGVHVSSRHSVHINAQAMVRDLRLRWAADRTADAAPNQVTLITHGFDARTIHRWSWGWSARVTLQLDERLRQLCQLRPALYMRDGYVLDYAYPVPGEADQWYAGTALQTQRKPKPLNTREHFTRWCRRFFEKTGDVVKLLASEDPIGGWRPVPRPDAPLIIELGSMEYAVRPQYGSAFRHWWTTAGALTTMFAERGFYVPVS